MKIQSAKLSIVRSFATLISFLLLEGQAFAGTTGKLAGRLTDKTSKEGLVSANVLIRGTTLGAAADIEGYYSIINVPPGTYDIQFSLVGYRQYVVKGVVITSDKTTKVDAEMEESAIEVDAVIVTATRPVVEVNATSSLVSISSKEIQALPVQELQDVVNLQAGVVDGHFRGGRLGEVQYQVNGVSINNVYNNSSSLKIDRSLLQEVQVISGTFDAEYGQAMSGVVNAVLKSGGDELQWNAEAYSGDFVFPGSDSRLIDYKLRFGAIQNYQLSVSGPTVLPQTYFIFNGRRFQNDGYLYGTRLFLPTDTLNFRHGISNATGDGKEFPLAFNREWSGMAKITNRSLSGIEIGYQALVNFIEGKRYDFSFRFIPDGTRTQKTFGLVHGLDWTHTLSASTFYNVSLRHNFFDYTDYVYASVNDPRYFAAGPPRSGGTYDVPTIVQGVDLNRYLQKTNTYVLKAAVTSQLTREHQVKAGVELQTSKVEFGVPGYILSRVINNVETLLVKIDEPPDFPGVQRYHPVSLAAYAQDQIEWHDLTLRAGARFEYFDARASVPSDLQNPANVIVGAPRSVPRSTTRKTSLAPRLGVSYPISASAALFFAYGHFYQMPELGVMFTNSNYEVLRNLQEGVVDYGVLGNPDIKPEKTVQYEVGYKNAITQTLGIEATIFYKDIRDLLGVEFVRTYAAAEYARLTNVDFGSVHGITLSIDERQLGPVSMSVDYTWQMARGNSSDPRETAVRASAGQDPRPRQVPLNWDQRHTLNMTAILQEPNEYSITGILRYSSGYPYTPSLTPGVFNADLETNSGTKPSSVLIDVRAEKYFHLGGLGMSFFVRVFNLLDTKFNNGFVFADTGSPYYTLDVAGARAVLRDPSRFYQPRRIEIGLSLNSAF